VQGRTAVDAVVEHVRATGFLNLQHGDQLVVVARRALETGRALDDQRLGVRAHIVGDGDAVEVQNKVSAFWYLFQVHCPIIRAACMCAHIVGNGDAVEVQHIVCAASNQGGR
jgi:hypothetical protein